MTIVIVDCFLLTSETIDNIVNNNIIEMLPDLIALNI